MFHQNNFLSIITFDECVAVDVIVVVVTVVVAVDVDVVIDSGFDG